MEVDTFKYRYKNMLPVFLQDREVEIIDYQEIFSLAFIKLKNSNCIFAVDIMVLFDKPFYENKINVE
ncbi:MAG: hypothetical protein N2645_20980 [Clostridia bacterium]|nr:hypothetical protein [Clostridia bacterium]